MKQFLKELIPRRETYLLPRMRSRRIFFAPSRSRHQRRPMLAFFAFMLSAASGVRDLRESRFRARSATRAKFEITLTCGCAHSLDLSSCKVSRADVHRARRSSVSRAGARAYTFVRVFCHEYSVRVFACFFRIT
jgi:hypothetical protein